MNFNLKALTKPINIMEQKMKTMTKEKREELALRMWYGATEFRGTQIGLEVIWKGITKKVIKTKKQYKEQKLSQKDLDKWKKFMLKKVYPNTEQSKPFRILIDQIETTYEKEKVKHFDKLLKDIKESKQKAFDEHMVHWTSTKIEKIKVED